MTEPPIPQRKIAATAPGPVASGGCGASDPAHADRRSRSDVVVFEDAVTALHPTGGFLEGFTHTFNPAIGCLFGRGLCGQFCYARESFAHRFRGRGGWGEYLVVKQNTPALLRRELRVAAEREPGNPEQLARIRVFSSSTTDPCLGPLLDVYGRCLAAVAERPPARWVIQTRSPLVLALRDRIEALGPAGIVSFTLESDTDGPLEPRGSPGIAARRRTLEELARWPVRLHVAVSPCLPLADPSGFADWLAELGALVTVDTFVTGDGSGGARTGRSPLPQLMSRRGLDWRDETGARGLLELLRARIGERAGWSAEGFRRLATI